MVPNIPHFVRKNGSQNNILSTKMVPNTSILSTQMVPNTDILSATIVPKQTFCQQHGSQHRTFVSENGSQNRIFVSAKMVPTAALLQAFVNKMVPKPARCFVFHVCIMLFVLCLCCHSWSILNLFLFNHFYVAACYDRGEVEG